MKRKLKYFGIIVLVTMFMFVACNGDPNNGNGVQTGDTVITTARITVIAPVLGVVPVTTAPAAGSGFTTSTVTWTPTVTGTFAGSTAYTASVTLTAREGFTFTGLVTAQINGVDADVTEHTAASVILSRTFPDTATPDVVNTVAINVVAPVTGAIPITTAPAGGTGFTCGVVTWDPVHSVFQVEEEYTATVIVSVTTGFNFAGNLTATINGETATVTNNTATVATLSYTFPPTDPAVIRTAGIEVTYPVTGAEPDTTVLAGSPGFTFGAVTWEPAVTGTFDPEVRYTATVLLTASAGYTFADSLDIKTINGWTAIETNNTEDTVTLSFQFPYTSPIPYIITANETSGFDAHKEGTLIGTAGSTMANLLTAIRTDADGENIGIQFGDGDTPLNVGGTPVAFSTAGSGAEWGDVILSGIITGDPAGEGLTSAVIVISGVTITSVADITNTNTSGTANVCIFIATPATLTIAGGSLIAGTGSNNSSWALRNNASGTVIVAGGIILSPTRTVDNRGGGIFTLQGGTVTGAGDMTIHNSDANPGTINLTGGLLENTNTTVGRAIWHRAAGGRVEISGTVLVSGRSAGTQGTIHLQGSNSIFEMTGGIVENIDTGVGYAINNDTSGTITITGGTVFKAGGGFSVRARGTSTATIGPNAVIIGNTDGAVTRQ
jgi:hypothetical protein